MSDINKLMTEYDRVASGLCLYARSEKVLPKQDADKVLDLIVQIKEAFSNVDSISRDYVWRLNYLFPNLLSEAEHCRDIEKKKALEDYAWNVQYHVSKVFEPVKRV